MPDDDPRHESLLDYETRRMFEGLDALIASDPQRVVDHFKLKHSSWVDLLCGPERHLYQAFRKAAKDAAHHHEKAQEALARLREAIAELGRQVAPGKGEPR